MTESHLVKSSSLSRTKLDQIGRCKTIPPFYISVEGWRFDTNQQAIFYTIEIGIELEQEVLVREKEYRYSELAKFHKQLVSHFPVVPDFPPKKFFGSTDQAFVRKRQTDLQKYCSQLSDIENLTRFPPFVSFFQYQSLKSRWAAECSAYEKPLVPQM